MWPIIDASVFVFPEPVAPVTRTRPRSSLGEPLDAGRQAEALEGGHVRSGSTRKANEIAPRWRNAVDAEPRQVVGRVGEVELAGLVELVEPLRGRRRSPARGRRRAPGRRGPASRRAAAGFRRRAGQAGVRSSDGRRLRRVRPRAEGGRRDPCRDAGIGRLTQNGLPRTRELREGFARFGRATRCRRARSRRRRACGIRASPRASPGWARSPRTSASTARQTGG